MGRYSDERGYARDLKNHIKQLERKIEATTDVEESNKLIEEFCKLKDELSEYSGSTNP